MRIFFYTLFLPPLLPTSGCGQEEKVLAGKPSGVSDIVTEARCKTRNTTSYDPSYVDMKCPNGDIDISKGHLHHSPMPPVFSSNPTPLLPPKI
jgi:hypothetical protein